MANALPIEIVDAILELVYYSNGEPDKVTLKSCAVISRAWTASAQRLLFRSVALRGVHHGREHTSFCEATNPSTEHGRALGEHVRIMEVYIGEKSGHDLDDSDLADLLGRTPRLYELILRVTGVHQFLYGTMERLAQLAAGHSTPSMSTSEEVEPLRIRALTLLSCGIQSPVLYQLLEVWPSIQFLYLGFELAAPPPKWTPAFHLYELSLVRTPRLSVLQWLLSSSSDSVQILSFRDSPGRDVDPLLREIGPRLRSLRLMDCTRRSAILPYCPNLEEFATVQLPGHLKLENLPPTLEHLSYKRLYADTQLLECVIDVLDTLPRLRALTCASQATADERFGELQRLCNSRGVRIILDEMPVWVMGARIVCIEGTAEQCFLQREDPVPVVRFPRRKKSMSNFALMN
ncbi:hypothetical protein PYCCODRAFT_1473793 [Trametes coccinea BRFM310]|uniref:F-box domain-containing protein n=1 Tax=Trametes coccinea (strain BRFM310) TaxID=1353009 RepID=A0A1Y2J1J5_TRAC3|nr:hypothetical protein PYCCODRAFT_1473793 [Trametes coccinea BRFM310]